MTTRTTTKRRTVFTRVLGLVAGFSMLTAVIPAAALAHPETAPPAPAPLAAGPELPSFPAALLYSLGAPDAEPPGANDWACRPATGTLPVVLVHGTWENRYNNFAKLSPELKRAGYCVFALNYGDRDDAVPALLPSVKGYGDIRISASELAAFVNRVRTATGSSKVDIVGHSQGGMMPRQYMKFEGGADKVRNLVTLGATHHGTTLSGIATLAEMLGILGLAPLFLGTAAKQQVVGSEFLRQLNAGGDTVPGVNYTVIATRYDEVTTPYDSTFLTAGPGARVRNITMQDGCEIDFSDHLSMSYSPRAIGLVRQGLDPTAPAAPCVPHGPVF